MYTIFWIQPGSESATLLMAKTNNDTKLLNGDEIFGDDA